MLRFACTGSRPEPYAAGPSLLLDVRVDEDAGRRVHAVVLRTQIRIEPRGRRYTPEEAGKLTDLFGEPSRWGETLNPLQLATVASTVPAFTGSTTLAVPVPLTYDLDVAAAKFFHGLSDAPDEDRADEDHVVPLLLLFSGTVFYAGPDGVQVGPVAWHEEATHRLPVAVWRAAMDEHFPGAAWVRLRRDTLDALAAHRSAHTDRDWDETVLRLLKEAGP
ncbi:hypothetical protein BJF78_14190 [Pseudonocardia sp. CNS-139]|nr:hypothetical protein BJF78_14190 [Pseudonocardia sp. CNS-139]